MSYIRHLEFMSNALDTNPNTGETKPQTIVDVYMYDTELKIWGWGWLDSLKYGEVSFNQAEQIITNVLESDGFKLIWTD
jgi:hypothetical protein